MWERRSRKYYQKIKAKNEGNSVDRETSGSDWGFLNFPQNTPILCSWGNQLANMFLMCHSTYPSTPIDPMSPEKWNHPKLKRRGFRRGKTESIHKNSDLEPRISEVNMFYFKHQQDLVLIEVRLHSRGITLYTANLLPVLREWKL